MLVGVRASLPMPLHSFSMSEGPARIYPGTDELLSAEIKHCPEDFTVTESLPFQPSGSGSHHWLVIEKQGLNTQEVAQRLARIAGVAVRDVGFAGMKDRYAVTRQSFSVPSYPDREPNWQSLEDQNLRILEITRHDRKLRRGVLRGNHFRLFLRQCQGDQRLWQTRLQSIGEQGFPNYFGAQRFGQRNLQEAARLLFGESRRIDRHRRGLLWSAARSALFNQVLAARVQQDCWHHILPGEVIQLAGSHSIFRAESEELGALQQRATDWDLHPTGPLPGRGGLLPDAAAGLLERAALAAFILNPEIPSDGLLWARQLAAQGLDAARRALRARPEDLHYEWSDQHTLMLEFFLPAGVFATSFVEALLGQESAVAHRLDLCVD